MFCFIIKSIETLVTKSQEFIYLDCVNKCHFSSEHFIYFKNLIKVLVYM